MVAHLIEVMVGMCVCVAAEYWEIRPDLLDQSLRSHMCVRFWLIANGYRWVVYTGT